MSEIEKLREIIKQKDKEIEELKEELKFSEERNDRLREENMSQHRLLSYTGMTRGKYG